MQYKTVFILVTTLFVTLTLNTATVIAADTHDDWKSAYKDWQNQYTQNKQQTSAESCQQLWDFVWPWAKRGNIEARGILYTIMTLPRRTSPLLPLVPTDYISYMRYLMILQVHSAGIQYLENTEEDVKSIYSEMSRFYEKQLGFLDTLSGGTYMSCIKNATTLQSAQSCTQTAEKEGLVPSFEDFASEVDIMIAQGLLPSCKELQQNKQISD